MCKIKDIDGNREYKDNVFRLLFGNESKSAELYNAVKGTNYPPDTLKMNTIQNPLFVGLRNDISFTVDDKFVILIEHQSSVNPNMGLRCLLYIARIYEQLMDKDGMYRTKPINIENPEFYVMYNGREEYPEKSTVKLSDLFKVKNGESNNLELTVTVYNINKGHNKNIMKRSRTLDEYAVFIEKVRYFIDIDGLELTEALNKAIKECIKENILFEFLNKHGGDVVSILAREFNLDDAKRVWAEETREDTQEKIARNLLKNGLTEKFVVENTGLSKEIVEKLAEKIKQK